MKVKISHKILHTLIFGTIFFVGSFIFASHVEAAVSVTYDAGSSAGGGTAEANGTVSLTWSHTVGSGDNRALIVNYGSQFGTTINYVKYGATSLTLLSSVTNGSKSSIYYLLNPPTGTATIDVNVTTGCCPRHAGIAASFSGVDQTDPFGTVVTSTTTNSVAATSVSGGMVFDAVMASGGPTLTVGGGQTQIAQKLTNTGYVFASSREAGAESVTMSWTGGSSGRGSIGIPINPAASAYFYSTTNTLEGRAWEDEDNWWADYGHSSPLGHLPNATDDVETITGSVVPYVDLDATCGLGNCFVPTTSLDVSATGITFTSAAGAYPGMNITGNNSVTTFPVTFLANAENMDTITGYTVF